MEHNLDYRTAEHVGRTPPEVFVYRSSSTGNAIFRWTIGLLVAGAFFVWGATLLRTTSIECTRDAGTGRGSCGRVARYGLFTTRDEAQLSDIVDAMTYAKSGAWGTKYGVTVYGKAARTLADPVFSLEEAGRAVAAVHAFVVDRHATSLRYPVTGTQWLGVLPTVLGVLTIVGTAASHRRETKLVFDWSARELLVEPKPKTKFGGRRTLRFAELDRIDVVDPRPTGTSGLRRGEARFQVDLVLGDGRRIPLALTDRADREHHDEGVARVTALVRRAQALEREDAT
jgi:hypothetical protein